LHNKGHRQAEGLEEEVPEAGVREVEAE